MLRSTHVAWRAPLRRHLLIEPLNRTDPFRTAAEGCRTPRRSATFERVPSTRQRLGLRQPWRLGWSTDAGTFGIIDSASVSDRSAGDNGKVPVTFLDLALPAMPADV
jgi:hypothetical protein